MNASTKTTLFHLVIWLVLSIGYFFLSEFITKMLFPGYDTVELWVMVVVSGLVIIFFAVMFSLAIRLWRRGKRMN